MKRLLIIPVLIFLFAGCNPGPTPVGPTVHDTLTVHDTVCIIPQDTLVDITADMMVNFRTMESRTSAGGEVKVFTVLDVWPDTAAVTLSVKKGMTVVVNWYKPFSVLPTDILYRDTLIAIKDTIL